MNAVIFSLIRGLHDVFAAVWVGGLFILSMVILPVAVRRGGLPLAFEIQNRLRKFVWVAIGVLGVTGILMARMRNLSGPLLSVPGPYLTIFRFKLVTVLAMIVIAISRQYLMFRKRVKSRAPAILLLANVSLGVVTMMLSGALTAIAHVSKSGM